MSSIKLQRLRSLHHQRAQEKGNNGTKSTKGTRAPAKNVASSFQLQMFSGESPVFGSLVKQVRRSRALSG
eukprot:s396_g20.t1